MPLQQRRWVHVVRRDLWPSDSWSGLARVLQVVSPALVCVALPCFRAYSSYPMSLGRAGSIFCMPVPWVSDATADALEEAREVSVSPLGIHLSAKGPALVN